MNSKNYIPSNPAYKNLIHSIWQVEGLTSFHNEQIIPKGVVEIIFNFSDSNRIPASLGSKQYHLSNCFINGFNTAPILVELPKHQVYFGIVFQPLAVKKIFGIPAREFSDITVDLTLVDSSLHALWHQLAEQNDFNKRVAIFLVWLTTNFHNWQPQETLINNFLYATNQHDLSVTKLADLLCYSPRQLSRRLIEATGMNAEEFLLYKKYLHAVDLMHHTKLSLTQISYKSHFSDQSHFIKTFKIYTSMTPGDYKRNMSYVKGHIYENVR